MKEVAVKSETDLSMQCTLPVCNIHVHVSAYMCVYILYLFMNQTYMAVHFTKNNVWYTTIKKQSNYLYYNIIKSVPVRKERVFLCFDMI